MQLLLNQSATSKQDGREFGFPKRLICAVIFLEPEAIKDI
ncbi:hypothetical protein RU95_GL000563 [Enterococcus avium]|nr:hypothetical protein RU95_GL000563 [Enterococcus avium]